MKASDVAQMGRRTRQDAPRGAIAKPSKYRNQKVQIGAERFDSKHEAEVWLQLVARARAGEITELQRQVRFSLYCPTAGMDSEVAVYVADYTWRDAHGALHVGDAKGQRKRICPYPLKAKWLKLQDGISIEEM